MKLLQVVMVLAGAIFLGGAGCAAHAQVRGSETLAKSLAGETTVRLWEGDAPGAKGTEEPDVPTLTVFPAPPDRATGAAIIICPGGGYGKLAPHEGKPVAEWLNAVGVTGFVLKYRLGTRYRHPAMMNDVQRAIRLVRARAQEWSLDPERVGVLGFSAGGHLAATAATHFDDGQPEAEDPVDRLGSRPDVAILIYPVITMQGTPSHGGSKQRLLGPNPDPELIELLSNERQVTEKTPPCFLVHTADDAGVPVENSMMFARACVEKKVPVELHVFQSGRHGFGLGGDDPSLRAWTELAARWLERHGFAKPPAAD